MFMRIPSSKDTIVTPILDRCDENEDIFYVAVNKKANIADLKESMLDEIAKIIKKENKPRIRKNKWKYYLIVYDLKQKFNDKITYSEIGDILNKAYPTEEKEYFVDTRNINHYYEYATSLINGDYIKHLKPTFRPTK
jgi:hypothetical protein